MKPSFVLSLAAALGLAACGSGAQSLAGATPPLLPIGRAGIEHIVPTVQRSSKAHLYVASANPYFFSEYGLPLRSGETPILSDANVDEPVPIFDDGSDLYVGSFDDGTIYDFSLPLSAYLGHLKRARSAGDRAYAVPLSLVRPENPAQLHAGPGAFATGLGDLSGLTEDSGLLYVAGAGGRHAAVLAYRLPLVAGERPSASLSSFSAFDLLGVAARNGTLFVASTIQGTVEAYRLPLGRKPHPEYAIPTVPQENGAAGLAVDGSGKHLYVALYTTGAVYEYRLPYVSSEIPKRLDVEAQTGGLPYGVALNATHLS